MVHSEIQVVGFPQSITFSPGEERTSPKHACGCYAWLLSLNYTMATHLSCSHSAGKNLHPQPQPTGRKMRGWIWPPLTQGKRQKAKNHWNHIAHHLKKINRSQKPSHWECPLSTIHNEYRLQDAYISKISKQIQMLHFKNNKTFSMNFSRKMLWI